MPARLLSFAALLVLLVAAPLAAPWVKLFLIVTLAKGLAVLGIVILLQAGQVSFGHALYFGAGAYAVAYVGRWPGGGELVTEFIAAAMAAALLGLLVGLFVVRYRYIFFGMLNLAFSMVFYSILEKFFNLTGGSDGLRVLRPTVLGVASERAGFETALYALTLGVSLAALVLTHRYFASPPGQMLRAIKSNETRLDYLGVSARRVLLGGYVASAMLCGIGGAITALAQGLTTPEFAFWTRSGEFVFIAILGGAGHVAGAFVGAFIFEGLRNGAAIFFNDAWQLVLGIALLFIVIYAPEGVCGLAARRLAKPRPDAPESAP